MPLDVVMYLVNNIKQHVANVLLPGLYVVRTYRNILPVQYNYKHQTEKYT